MKEIYFRRPYHKLNEMDYGAYHYAIVIYEKRPEQYKTQLLGAVESKQKGYNVENIVVQYKHFLQIDLWLCVIRLSWLGKDKRVSL